MRAFQYCYKYEYIYVEIGILKQYLEINNLLNYKKYVYFFLLRILRMNKLLFFVLIFFLV